MIPRAKLDLRTEVPPEFAYQTPRKGEYDEEGFGFFRDTWLIRDVGIRSARDIIAVEAVLVDLVGRLSENAVEFDQLSAAVEGADQDALPDRLAGAAMPPELVAGVDFEVSPLEGLELGVSGLTFALAALGCWPAASCRGHPGSGAWSSSPVVYFAADRHRVDVLRAFAMAAGCGFAVDPARPDLLVVVSESVSEMLHLADLIVGERQAFTPRRTPRPSGPEGGGRPGSSQGMLF